MHPYSPVKKRRNASSRVFNCGKIIAQGEKRGKQKAADIQQLFCLFFNFFHTAGLIDAVRNEKPDIICATGDMAHDTGSFEPFINLLQALINIAPVYIVSGNHDVWRSDYNEMVKKCRDLGATYLEDERIFINKGDDKVAVTGISDPFSSVGVTINKNIDRSLEKLTKYEGYEIVFDEKSGKLLRVKDNRAINEILADDKKMKIMKVLKQQEKEGLEH